MAQSNLIGPLTLTVGQPYKLSLDPNMNRVDVANDSPNDVYLYFGQVAPTADLTNENNSWHALVRRQHNQTVPVAAYRGASAAERSPNAWGAFDGTVWLLAVNAGQLAQSGTVSGRNQLFVRGLYPGDPAPVHSALATQVDLTSQPRIVHVPVGMLQWSAGNWNPGSGDPFDVLNLSWNADILAAQHAVVYFYGCSVMPAPGQTGSMGFSVEAQPVDSGGGNIGSPVQMFWGSVFCNDTNKTGSGCFWQSPFPLCFIWQPGDWPANMDHLHILLKKQTGDNIAVNFALAVNTDRTNTEPNAEIGNQGLWVSGSANAPLF